MSLSPLMQETLEMNQRYIQRQVELSQGALTDAQELEVAKVFYMLWQSEMVRRQGLCPRCGGEPTGVDNFQWTGTLKGEKTSGTHLALSLRCLNGHIWGDDNIAVFDHRWRPAGWHDWMMGRDVARETLASAQKSAETIEVILGETYVRTE